MIGEISLIWRSVEDRQGEIGYIFNPDQHGRGYATEAANAMLRYGFEELGLHRIHARCDLRNSASWRVMERLGMRREAHFRRARDGQGRLGRGTDLRNPRRRVAPPQGRRHLTIQVRKFISDPAGTHNRLATFREQGSGVAEDALDMAVPDRRIVTDRLILRPFIKADLDEMMEYYALPDVQRYLDWKARDRVEAKAALDAMTKQVRLTRPGDTLALAVTRQADDLLVGHVSLRWTDAVAAQAELRFVFNSIYRRQGYASEAVSALLTVGFEQFHLHRIFARCAGQNQASARLLKALGMRLEAHFREHAMFQGEWDEELHFALIDREWRRGSAVRN